MPYALALTGILLVAKALDEASADSPHFGWGMTGLAFFIVAGGMV